MHRDLRRMLRSPRALFTGVLWLAVPYALAGARFGRPVLVMGAAIACYWAVKPAATGLRTIFRSVGLQRALPFAPTDLRLGFGVAPALVAVLWSGAAMPVIRDPTVGYVLALCAVSAVMRRAIAPPPRYDGPLIATPAGAAPPGLMSRPLRGVDVLFIGVLPAMFGAPSWLTLAVPLLILLVVVSGAVEEGERFMDERERRRRLA